MVEGKTALTTGSTQSLKVTTAPSHGCSIVLNSLGATWVIEANRCRIGRTYAVRF